MTYVDEKTQDAISLLLVDVQQLQYQVSSGIISPERQDRVSDLINEIQSLVRKIERGLA